MKLVPIDQQDAENLCFILNDEISRMKEKEMQFLLKEITLDQIKWYRSHTKYLEGLNKLLVRILNQHLPKLKKARKK